MPERLEVEVHRGTIEHAQHDALAELRRQRGDAQIDLRPAMFFWMRPSCGRRRSAMFRFAMTLRAR